MCSKDGCCKDGCCKDGCSKTRKAQRERLYCGPVLEALPCNFIKTGFHHQEFSDKLLPKAYLND